MIPCSTTFSKPLSKNTINTDSSLYHQTLYFLHTIIWKNSWKTNDQLLVTVLCYDYKCYRVPSLFWFFFHISSSLHMYFSFLITTCEFSCSLCILVSSMSFFSCHAFYSLSYTIRFYFVYVFLRLRYVGFYLILRFFLHNIRFFLTSYDNSCYLHTISFTIYMTLSSLRTIFLVFSLRYFLRSFPIVS